MERKTIETEVGAPVEIDIDYWCDDKPYCINALIEHLTDSKENGATHVKLHGSYDGDCVNEVEIQPIKVELESDEDYNKRVKEVEEKRTAWERLQEAEEREMYEKLKLKYGE